MTRAQSRIILNNFNKELELYVDYNISFYPAELNENEETIEIKLNSIKFFDSDLEAEPFINRLNNISNKNIYHLIEKEIIEIQ